MQNSIPTLTEAACRFALWRKSRASNQSRTPEKLKQLAVTLLKHYPIAVVSSELQTCRSSLTRWQAELESTGSEPRFVPESEFIELSTPELPAAVREMSLTIEYPSGAKLKLEGSPEDSMLHMLLTSLQMGGSRP